MGLLYFALPDDSSSLRPKVNMLLNMLAFFCLMPYVSMSIYYASKSTYLADVTAKLYSPSAYYVAKVLATLPFQLMSSGTFTFVLYGMAGLRHSTGAILMTTSITTITSLIAVQARRAAGRGGRASWRGGRAGLGRRQAPLLAGCWPVGQPPAGAPSGPH